jgi:hypothetical protein
MDDLDKQLQRNQPTLCTRQTFDVHLDIWRLKLYDIGGVNHTWRRRISLYRGLRMHGISMTTILYLLHVAVDAQE